MSDHEGERGLGASSNGGRGDADGGVAPAAGDAAPAVTAGPAASPAPSDTTAYAATTGRRVAGKELFLALLFLVPALAALSIWLIYPVGFTVVRSLFDAVGDRFVGFDNYRDMFDNESTFTAIRNNAVWVVVAPTVVTAVGLVFAVLTERIKFATAFKLVVFMPMAISFFASGVIFKLVYEEDPDRGLLNALATGVVDIFDEPGQYPGARPTDESLVAAGDADLSEDTAYLTADRVSTGASTPLGLVAVNPRLVPESAEPVGRLPAAGADELAGAVWLDFTPGGGGEKGAIDPGEVGLPGVKVEALDQDGAVVGSATTDERGHFVIEGVERGSYALQLPEGNFAPAFAGFEWLGPSLVTPAVIGSFIWIWAGFAMVLIAAGLSAIPRETMEAARVDGANEWQVFRRVTVPLLRPVLLVVLVTLMINVLKIFDLVLVIPPGSVQDDANVIALELWKVSFGGAQDQGLGSALGVLLFILVLPAMAFNIRRFRSEES